MDRFYLGIDGGQVLLGWGIDGGQVLLGWGIDGGQVLLGCYAWGIDGGQVLLGCYGNLVDRWLHYKVVGLWGAGDYTLWGILHLGCNRVVAALLRWLLTQASP